MEEETKLARIVTTGLAVAFCTLVLTMGSCTANTHNRISQDLHSGLDPLAVACAHGNDGAKEACIILATKGLSR